ncbi:MAG: hypothetical protein HUJ25_06495 [Crocinitomicaceae bacterium]|nr:hypothetical protein [Crocinitomicaceae bacterium]
MRFINKMIAGFVLLIGVASPGFSNTSIEGTYQGKNLFVQSPESEDGFGFCVTKVTVNGDVSAHSPQASAFQIDLSEFSIQIGEKVLVVLEHEDGCKPKLLNPEVLLPKSTFILEDISCTPDGTLSWKTTGESGSLNYQIEQYKWNKWVVVGETNGIGNAKPNEYLFNVSPHSGENKLRVTQTDNTGNKRVSKEVTFVAKDIPEPQMVAQKGKIIEFVSNGEKVITKYEVFDAYGNIVKKGMNHTVDCSNLKDGVYHVNYDNKHEKFIKK